jgi:murein DD-endopeptidase MepM/ murein hydrolase activator NlpD
MAISTSFAALALAVIASATFAARPLQKNFYVDQDASASKTRSHSGDKSQAAADSKPSAHNSDRHQNSTTRTPAKAAKAEKKKSGTQTSDKAPAQKKADHTTSQADDKNSRQLPDSKYDPYGLEAYFTTRFDLLHYTISPDEAALYLRDSFKSELEQIDKAASAMAQAVEQRNRNIQRSATALYLAGRYDLAPCYYPDLLQPHRAALRSTIEQDARDMRRAQELVNPLRAEANRIADAVEHPPTEQLISAGPANSITESVIDLVHAENEALLQQRSPAANALLARLAAEELMREQRKRSTLASFAPPPPVPMPVYNPIVSPDTPIPSEVFDKPPRKPELPSLNAPQHAGEVVRLPLHAPVHCAEAGTVAFAGEFRGYGRLVIIEHADGLFSIYGFLSSITVKEGDRINQGGRLGFAGQADENGTTGFYFELRKGTETIPLARFPQSQKWIQIASGKI